MIIHYSIIQNLKTLLTFDPYFKSIPFKIFTFAFEKKWKKSNFPTYDFCKKTLVLDLDETLVHCEFEIKPEFRFDKKISVKEFFSYFLIGHLPRSLELRLCQIPPISINVS